MSLMARHKKRETRTYLWFHDILRALLAPLLVWFYRLQTENLAVFRRIRPPYLVIPNHVMTWDPVIASCFVREPIHFVASDANFRSSFFSFWLRRVGAIAKSKLMDDFGTLRTIMRFLRDGKVVGLYAEGQRTWDGRTQPIIPSTAKLVKAARVPVIVPVMKGAYLSLPRWAFRSRRGSIIIDYRLALTREEVERMDVEAIQERIESVMHHDEDAYQREAQIPYTHARAAEPLQLLLFTCPSCSGLNTMKSERRRFFCTRCGYSVRYSIYGHFTPDRSSGSSGPASVVHRTISDWSDAQTGFLHGYLAKLFEENDSEPIFADEGVLLSTGYRMAKPHRIGLGRLELHLEGLQLSIPGQAERFFRWSEIRALNVVYQDQIEFYYRRRLIVLEFPSHDTSGYKYLLCGETLAKLSLGRREDVIDPRASAPRDGEPNDREPGLD